MKLRILTFNLFFDEVARSVRMKAIGRLVEHFRPAVIGFQEVTRDALAMLKGQQWAKFYDCSVDTAPPFQETYFVTLFSAIPVKSLETHPFGNTGMGRELVVMEVEPIPGTTLFVGTSHLESLPKFAAPRVSQLKESLTLLRDRVVNAGNEDEVQTGDKRPRNSGNVCLGAVFMGDTNLMKADMKLLDRRLAAFADVDVELAKTGRSKCRTCGEGIEKGAVRVGKMAKDTVARGKVLEIRVWFHDNCFLSAASTTDDEKKLVARKGKELRGEELDRDDGEEVDLATMGLPGGWKDLWLSVPGNTEENGYTFDGSRNTLVTSRSFRSRLDRMYFYSAPGEVAGRCVLDEIVIVGQQKIADGLWPSDHFGLLSTFTVHEDKKDYAAGNGDKKKARRIESTSNSGSKQTPIPID
ncbi:hypothetical protein PHYPSEUDO_005936 [Phytophthora pseudosyringae]|uniref:PARP-type domain-containing protein n=1 Tax=Phytophthora pseudosyringae TaxID=221518 RepID=A0A8T1VNB3_9STRA|nr:hypothetical protein PHYPSEUDO_005936 [Phytophthora pseudosyringae]